MIKYESPSFSLSQHVEWATGKKIKEANVSSVTDQEFSGRVPPKEGRESNVKIE